MTEPNIILLITAGTLLWPLGGYRWKGWRRFVWPVCCALSAYFSGTAILRLLAMTLTVFVATVLPYGDRTPWPVKILVFGTFALPAVVIDPSLWWFPVITATVLGVYMYLSRKYNWVAHKVWEACAGFLQAALMVLAFLK